LSHVNPAPPLSLPVRSRRAKEAHIDEALLFSPRDIPHQKYGYFVCRSRAVAGPTMSQGGTSFWFF